MLLDLGPRKKDLLLRVPPPPPETNWRPPTEFPNLSAATVVAVDLERKEYSWKKGPGWSKRQAHTIGISLAARDRLGNRGKWYFPFAHEVEPEYNMPKANVIAYCKHVLENQYTAKLGANLYYDAGSLTDDGIYLQGQLNDIQFAEALLNSEDEVNLDYLGFKYLGRGKAVNQLKLWINTVYGSGADFRQHLWRTSPRLAGVYAEDDADMTIDIFDKQYPLLSAANQLELFRLECDLLPLLIQMRINGVRINMNAAEQLYYDLAADVAKLYEKLQWESGVVVNSVMSADECAAVFDAVGAPYPRTEPTAKKLNGTPSFKKEWLLAQEHPVAKTILQIRELEKMRSTFLRSYILEGAVDGIVHCCFNQMRGDEDGAKTGRFSSAFPNLQNIPVRSNDFSIRPTLGKDIRRLFLSLIPGAGVRKGDYSQIEYRYLAHFACGAGSDELRAGYNADPKTDYHNSTFYRLAPLMGWDITDKKLVKDKRRPVKNINFGLVYGMGKRKLLRALMQYFHTSTGAKEVESLYSNYHIGNPYVKPTMEMAAHEVEIYGYSSTILGRRVFFNDWEPIDKDYDNPAPALPYEKAIRVYGSRIKRSGLHKSINYKLQGSAAEQIKVGMLQCYMSGVFDVIGLPMLQVHDELVFNHMPWVPHYEEAFAYAVHILENSIPLKVPVIFDYSDGKSWGDAEKE